HLPVRPFTLALLLIRRPPTPTLFPYTTLFRSSKRVPLAHKLPWSRPPCRQGRQSGRLRSLMTSPRHSLDRQQQRRSTAVDAQQDGIARLLHQLAELLQVLHLAPIDAGDAIARPQPELVGWTARGHFGNGHQSLLRPSRGGLEQRSRQPLVHLAAVDLPLLRPDQGRSDGKRLAVALDAEGDLLIDGHQADPVAQLAAVAYRLAVDADNDIAHPDAGLLRRRPR